VDNFFSEFSFPKTGLEKLSQFVSILSISQSRKQNLSKQGGLSRNIFREYRRATARSVVWRKKSLNFFRSGLLL
jgi:hypothetical protein